MCGVGTALQTFYQVDRQFQNTPYILGDGRFQIFLDKYSPLTALQNLCQVDEEEAGSLVLPKPLSEGWLVKMEQSSALTKKS